MNRMYWLVGLLLINSCGVFNKDKNETEVNDTLESATEDGSNLEESYDETPKIYRASETIFTDLIHTKLEVSFDWSKSWMFGKATITAKPHFYATDSLFLDAKGMEIKSVVMNGSNLLYKYDGENLRIKLDKKYTRTEKYDIVINYVAKPDERETSGSAAITSDKGLYFINPTGAEQNKMPQIWTQGETESSSVWFPTVDQPNAKTTQEIFITVDQKFATLSNGKLIKSTANSNGTRTDHWKQDLPHAPYLFMMGIGEFKVVKDSYTRSNGQKMEVNYYVEPEWEAHAKAIFGETPAMIDFFSKLTKIEYPWDKYHQIVVREYVSGAMENTGAVIFGDYAYKTDRELLDENDQSTIAHELFHHWFGDLVTCESWSNLPLNESFANYSQYLWDEYRYGLDEADYNAEQEANGYFQSASNSGYHNLIWFDYDDKEQMFDGHSYNKGGRILHMLRNYLGDEAFFEGMSNYLNANKFKAAEIHHLRLAFEEVCGQDLNWFFNQWFFDNGHPSLQIEQYFSEANQEVILTVNQKHDLFDFPLFKLPMQVAVVDDAGTRVHDVVIDKVENKIILPVKGKLKTVIFDYQQMLLAEITYEKPAQEYIAQYYASNRFVARRDAILYGTAEDSPEGQQLILDALKDPFWKIREEAIVKAVFLTGENQKTGLNIIRKLVTTDSKSQVRAAALDFLSEELEALELEKVLIDRMDKDQSYLVIGDALARFGVVNPVAAMQKAKLLENESSSKMKTGVAQLYATQGGKEQFPFFEKLMTESKLQGYDAIYGLNSFTLFIIRQEDELLSKVTPILRAQQEKGGFYAKMFMPQVTAYIFENMNSRIAKSEELIASYEKSNDPALADQVRKKLKLQQASLAELSVFAAEIEKQ